MTSLIILPAATQAIARVRAEARAAVTDLSLPASRHVVAWYVLRGARNPKARQGQANMGAAVPSPDWRMSAVVISAGAQSWSCNDA